MKADKILNAVTGWALSSYMFSLDRKFLPGLPNARPLIQGQLFYGQSTSPYKLSCLNCEYRYLQLLLSLCIYPSYIFACVCQEIKSKGGEPLTFSATGKGGETYEGLGEVIFDKQTL